MSFAKKRAAEPTLDDVQAVKRSRSEAVVVWAKVPPRISILYGTHLSPTLSTKAAIFDLDGTLIKTKSNHRFAANAQDWQWWAPGVPTELSRLAQQGFHIVILSNQAGLTNDKKRGEWKHKVELIAAQLGDVPFTVLAATAKDAYRKPMTGMWEYLQSERVSELDIAQTFFVGDAAGRPGDHSDSDRKFALNVGISFETPEEYFLKAPRVQYRLKGFRPSPDSFIVPDSYKPWEKPDEPHLVIFVGRPKSGKTEFYNRHMLQQGYARISHDLEFAQIGKLLKSGKSVVIDNQNPTRNHRKKFIRVAKSMGATAICIKFDASVDLAWHNNIYQAFQGPKPTGKAVSKKEFSTYELLFQDPAKEEGFDQIYKMEFFFEDSPAARTRWNLWLLEFSEL